MDSTGEVVAEAGAGDERQRLIGIYQGIVLSAARRVLGSRGTDEIDYVLSRYEAGTLILRPLPDGYYMVFLLTAGSDVARGLRRSATVQARLIEAM
jgi:hypothetical protein